MTELRIIGAGGHGKVVADTAEASGYSDIAFLDQSYPEHIQNGRWKVIGIPKNLDVKMFCAVGQKDIRARIFKEYRLNDSPALVHPSVILSPTVKMGSGVLVVAGSGVHAETSIGQGAILNTACSVDHDCIIGDFVHICPGARLAGNVRVGNGTWIGIGAAVVSDIEDGARVGGVPARSF